MPRSIHFAKMHGAGNDYIYVYTPDNPAFNAAEASRLWSQPHFGIGSDGLILIGRSLVPEADFTMRIFNNDGSEAMMCGNGIRCVGKFLYDHQLTDKTTIAVDTLSGIKQIMLHINEEGEVHRATVDMGKPMLQNRAQLRTPDGSMQYGVVGGFRGTFVSMGNPHFVIFTEDADAVDVVAEGRQLEYNEIFPERCNIEFATLLPNEGIRLRSWERGSGLTLACGTGACATAVAACVNGLRGRRSDIITDGGTLHIHWDEDDGHVRMTGPAETVFEGSFPLQKRIQQ